MDRGGVNKKIELVARFKFKYELLVGNHNGYFLFLGSCIGVHSYFLLAATHFG